MSKNHDHERSAEGYAPDRDRSSSAEPALGGDGFDFTASLLPEGSRLHLPEISLLAAIFDDAVHCIRRDGGGITHRQTSEALAWIASGRRDWPFAFANVCDFLGIDAEDVRTRLRVEHQTAAR